MKVFSTDCSKMDSSTEKPATLNTVTAGGVGGALVLVIVIEFIAILFLWKFGRLVPLQTDVLVLKQ